MVRLLLSVLALAAAGYASQAHASRSYDNCTGFIDSLPATISRQGTWCLRKDLYFSPSQGVALTVLTNNVTLDCNDFEIGAGGFSQDTPEAIRADNRQNVTVRNCAIVSFRRGIVFSGENGGSHLVEDNVLELIRDTGLSVEGDGSVVRRNRVSATVNGIDTTQNVDVLDNDVYGQMWGIITRYSAATIARNRLRGMRNGVTNLVSARITVRDNEMMLDTASAYAVGISCSDAYGRAERNVVAYADEAIQACSSTGNYVLP